MIQLGILTTCLVGNGRSWEAKFDADQSLMYEAITNLGQNSIFFAVRITADTATVASVTLIHYNHIFFLESYSLGFVMKRYLLGAHSVII